MSYIVTKQINAIIRDISVYDICLYSLNTSDHLFKGIDCYLNMPPVHFIMPFGLVLSSTLNPIVEP